MKIVNCDLHKVALAALVLGVFSLNPLAKADEEQLPEAKRDGLKWGELRSLSANTFSVRVDGDMLVFTGSIPKGCATGRSMSEVDSGEGRHALTINLPNCPQGDTSRLSTDDKKLVQVKAAFPAKAFNSSVDGKFCLLYSANGDGEAGCDPIMVGGKQLEHVSQGTLVQRASAEQDRRDTAAREAQARREREDRERKEKALIEKLKLLCKQGDFVGFGAEIEAARAFLGDVTKIIEQMDAVKKKFFEDAIKKAKADDVKTAYENYLQAASENGWDTEEVTAAYVARRIDLMKEAVNGSDSAEKRAGVVRELISDLRELDAYRANRASIAWAYAQIASGLRDAEKLDEAEIYFGRAIEHAASQDDKVKLEAEMAKMFNQAAEACLEKNKLSPGKCDKLAKKSQKHMDAAIAAQGKIKGEDAADALKGMQVEKIQMFGQSGYSMHILGGYGNLNPNGGAYDMKKRQLYQQGQQEMYMQYMMRMQMGPMGMQGAGSSGGSFFR